MNKIEDDKRELPFKCDEQEYAQVSTMLGNWRCEALCIDGKRRLCHIQYKMHKKGWTVVPGDIILVDLEDYQYVHSNMYKPDEASLLKAFNAIYKYNPEEARLLKVLKQLPENVHLNEGVAGGINNNKENLHVNEDVAGGINNNEEDGHNAEPQFEDDDINKV